MKKLLILLVLAGGAYGVYLLIEDYSGKAVTRAAREVSGGHLERAQRQLERTAEKMEGVKIETVRNAVIRFNGDNGRLPANLDELVQAGYLDSFPAGVTYDSTSGEVKAGG